MYMNQHLHYESWENPIKMGVFLKMGQESQRNF